MIKIEPSGQDSQQQDAAVRTELPSSEDLHFSHAFGGTNSEVHGKADEEEEVAKERYRVGDKERERSVSQQKPIEWSENEVKSLLRKVSSAVSFDAHKLSFTIQSGLEEKIDELEVYLAENIVPLLECKLNTMHGELVNKLEKVGHPSNISANSPDNGSGTLYIKLLCNKTCVWHEIQVKAFQDLARKSTSS